MNIISNTCIGAYITRDILKEQYQNPFSWSIIDYDSFKSIIENYNNLQNMEITCKIIDNNNFPSVFLNGCIRIDFVHIILKSKQNKCPFNKNNIFIDDKDIISYTLNKFKTRLSRRKDSPIFVLQHQPNHPITGDTNKLKRLLDVNLNYPLIILSNDETIKSKDHILVLHIDDKKSLNVPKCMADLLGPVMLKFT